MCFKESFVQNITLLLMIYVSVKNSQILVDYMRDKLRNGKEL